MLDVAQVRKIDMNNNITRVVTTSVAIMALLASAGCNQSRPTSAARAQVKSDGPTTNENANPHPVGNAGAGQGVFRFETFGNEGFWTDAMRLPKGMMDAKFTPVQALKAGLMVDIEALDSATKDALSKELKTDLSPREAPLLNDPKTTLKLVNANAVIGVVAVDSNHDGKMTVEAGDKVGIACAICHTITDESAFALPHGGSIGQRVDGPANNRLNMGALLAMAANSRAYYPNLQAELGGKTMGRAPKGLTKDSTEAEVDAYLMNPKFYPIGTFDETSDGNGNPVANTPFFRTDLAAPWGTSAANARLEDISNGSYTINLDLTTLVTPEGRHMLAMKAGAAGEELANNYAHILKVTGVTGYPFVKAALSGKPGEEATPVGRRVDNQKLLDMNAYTDRLPAPPGARVDGAAASRGRELFRQNCTGCHNVDQSRRVPQMLVAMPSIFPGYRPKTVADRKSPMSAVQDSPGTFDDKMIVEDASARGEIRGVALPLLLDLSRKPFFLHDASVPSLKALLDPDRGARAPHPFYLTDMSERADVVEFLRGLDANSGQQAHHRVSQPRLHRLATAPARN
jgi:mono/diheme cytochrome c family protein